MVKTTINVTLTIESEEPLPADPFSEAPLAIRMVSYLLSTHNLQSYMYTNWHAMGNASSFPIGTIKSKVTTNWSTR